MYYVDGDRRITFWNKAAETITGYSRQEVLGIRCSDNLLRHVDDEGVCLCLGSCPQVKLAGEAFRRLVAHSAIPRNGSSIRVTISLGASLVRPGDTLETITERVDRLIYQSKTAGRNCLHLE